ncbi:MAG: hypothetical protein A2Y53_07305 [Chloroflexi bacterium RBG_16_47_49]|nr:MAG: hypothetical protein A2Y53_07305 [Chloroflexi bacterium RBG_16_47_49]
MGNKLRLFSFILAVVGLTDSLYLSWVKVSGKYALCGPIGDCESVNSSKYSEIAGIPIAFLGVGAYLVILVLLFLESRGNFWMEYSPLLVFGISLAGVLYSAYLTYLEIAVIRAICPYCVVSAIVLIFLLMLSVQRMLRGQGEPSSISYS